MDREFQCGACRIGRRAALELGLGFALAPRLALAQVDTAREKPHEGDLLVPVGSTADAKPLTPDDLPLGAKQTMAWPMDPASNTVRSGSRLNKVLLVRLDPNGLDPVTSERAAEGVVAYSAICPHTGCDVISWNSGLQLLECPCHYSHFDPKAGARVVSGPAPRGLAALPLKGADGRLVVAKPFVGRLGIQQT